MSRHGTLFVTVSQYKKGGDVWKKARVWCGGWKSGARVTRRSWKGWNAGNVAESKTFFAKVVDEVLWRVEGGPEGVFLCRIWSERASGDGPLIRDEGGWGRAGPPHLSTLLNHRRTDPRDFPSTKWTVSLLH